ncbi:nucleoside triphosphate pyrophosphohydrolase [Terrihabitans sp. B22-R8]|uniref:nucleoside triphosphate pyrophosphohydrolase n=1 Tax=Terrihabitans sp. B22-R8 TaxID=3425128 RepID=UPI00403C1828
MTPSRNIADLLDLMAALRDPETGCAWDLQQTFETIAPFTLEEAAEVVDAIARNDIGNLRDELGDLLLQVVFHSRIAEEKGSFAFGDVVEAITSKLIRRHPHIFGGAGELTAGEVKELWNKIKREEKLAQRPTEPIGVPPSLLQEVPGALPALSRSVALQTKAGSVGFDWNSAQLILDKIHEEAEEVRETLEDGVSEDDRIEEIGDLLFAVTNLARHMKVDPEIALRRANAKFERRFHFIETSLAEAGRRTDDANLDEMEALWNQAKLRERIDRAP